jgi:3-deoxy-manno-octulosonate cytidylyltransferase (CMP-KDO synthetase)
MKILGIIPARYASTRFPGKPLASIGGISMIERVYAQCKKSNLTDIIIATDDARIESHCQPFGTVMMTSAEHPSGTDRCNEVLTKSNTAYNYVVNIQGDEPFIDPHQINLLISLLDGQTQIATLIKKIESAEHLVNPNVVKAVKGIDGRALYFSRLPVPHIRSKPEKEWLTHHTFYKHIGMYAYRADVLPQLAALRPSALEKAESLEQLRWLENGFTIQTAETTIETIGIDTPDDLVKAEDMLRLNR